MADEILRVWIRDPLNDPVPAHGLAEPADQLPEPSTRAEAELRAATIRASLERFIRDTEDAIMAAYLHRDWVALEYASWADYVRGEFGIARLKLPKDERAEIVTRFHLMGMSTRAIASALGAGQDTVRKDLQLHQPGAVETVVGVDGKRRPAKRRMIQVDDTPDPAFCRVCGHACAHEVPCGLGEGPDGPQCVNTEACAARVAAEVVVPAREVEWPQVAVPGGAVESATPPGVTAEAPADEPAAVTWKGWRQHTDQMLSAIRADLGSLTGDFADPATFAQRATEIQLDALTELAERLASFVADVRAQRAPSDGHVDRRGAPALLKPIAPLAEFHHQAKPCKRCWPSEQEIKI